MKKIVCEMCECTDFIKKDGLFECQECGCKYTMEDAKKLMKDFPDEETNENTDCAQNNSKAPEIPLHTSDSPNQIIARVVKVGHSSYTRGSMTLSYVMGGEPRPEFINGPDCVGHIGAEVYLENISGKEIKYATIYVVPFNAVGDIVSCTVQNYSEYGIEFTGPLGVGKKISGYLDGIWYNNSIVSAQITRVHVVYMDGTEEMYDYTKDINKNFDTKTRSITITRKWAYPACAVKLVVYKDGVEMFKLKPNESRAFIADSNPFEIVVAFENPPTKPHSIKVNSGENAKWFEVKVGLNGIKSEEVQNDI